MTSDLAFHPALRSAATTIDGVLLYDEQDLLPPPKCPQGTHGPALSAALCRAAGAAEREREVRAELRALGVRWLEFGKLQPVGETLQPRSLLRTYAPPGWAAEYCAQRLWEGDPRLRGASPAGAPFTWTVPEPRRPGRAAEPVARVFEALAARGVGSGMTICLAAAPAHHVVAMHCLSVERDPGWATSEAMARALLLGVCLHEFISMQTLPDAIKEPASGMSAVQTRIAGCVLQGFSDKEVARSLALSQYAVDYHLRALRQRFNVRNRVQLAQAILGTGVAVAA
jgi:DNA-binding CsgD family transcriptional regulator